MFTWGRSWVAYLRMTLLVLQMTGKLIMINCKKKIYLRHIVDVSKEKTQKQVVSELTDGFGLNNLFGEEEHFESRKAYRFTDNLLDNKSLLQA
jgi:hypothetical protein